MEVLFSGYKSWKHSKNEMGMANFYVLPTISIHYDDVFEEDGDYPIEIKIAWLIWSLHIYLK